MLRKAVSKVGVDSSVRSGMETVVTLGSQKIRAWSYSRNCANNPVILTVSVGLRGYMYNG